LLQKKEKSETKHNTTGQKQEKGKKEKGFFLFRFQF